jgi:hypothetical protein
MPFVVGTGELLWDLSRTPITPRLTRREFLWASAAELGALALGRGGFEAGLPGRLTAAMRR